VNSALTHVYLMLRDGLQSLIVNGLNKSVS